MEKDKESYLREPIEHIDITKIDAVPLIESYSKMAFQARNLARGAKIYEKMLKDEEAGVILTLAGSIFSAGLKKTVYQMVKNNMVDAIVSTGALIVDQDFFEALGFKHYIGTQWVNDNELRGLHIDRIYDTYIDEDELRVCDMTIAKIADSLPPKPYSSREFIWEMGRYLKENGSKCEDSIVLAAYGNNVPIFVPAFSDCSAGFGLIYHQWHHPEKHVSIDSAKDFLELTKLKLAAHETGILMIGGGVPKNFTQDVVVATDILGKEAPMHKYAVQITVADERDGALSGSTLKEASSWGKVETTYEQMIWSEATLSFPILAAYGYQKVGARRRARNFARIYEKPIEAKYK